MANDDTHVPASPPHAQPPRGVDHLVLNVRNLEGSHRFWTEIMGGGAFGGRPALRLLSRSVTGLSRWRTPIGARAHH